MNAERVIGSGLLVATLVFAADRAAAQPPAPSFAALQSVLKPGQQVVVRDDHGVFQGGTVVSIDASQLEIRWPK